MTDEELNDIVSAVISKITDNSVNVATVDVINDLDSLNDKGVSTLPGSDKDGNIVQVAISVLTEPVNTAIKKATEATTKASEVTGVANTATEAATNATNLATEAASTANAAAATATSTMEDAVAKAEEAISKAENTNTNVEAAISTMDTKFGSLSTEVENSLVSCSEAVAKVEEISSNIGNKKLLVVTESQYSKLAAGETITIDGTNYTLDVNTIYFATEEG